MVLSDIRAIAGYFRLDGFDLGVGVLSCACETDAERALVRRSTARVGWQRVWLPSGRGARCLLRFRRRTPRRFRGFTWRSCSCLWPDRAVSLEFGAHDPNGPRMGCVLYGRFVFARPAGRGARQGIAGVPLAANGDYAGMLPWLAFAVYARRWRAGICDVHGGGCCMGGAED